MPTHIVSRYYARRAADAEGRPGRKQTTCKTPTQRAMLQEVFEDDPYPRTLEIIGLVYETGLSPQQVKSWFEYQRAKVDISEMATTKKVNDPNESLRLWREFDEDEDTFMQTHFLPVIEKNEDQLWHHFQLTGYDARAIRYDQSWETKQLPMLQSSFAEDTNPWFLEIIRLVHITGLTKIQVLSWFENERKKYDSESLWTRNVETDPKLVDWAWKEYDKDPRTFMQTWFVPAP